MAVGSRNANRDGATPKLIELQKAFVRHNCDNAGIMGIKEAATVMDLPEEYYDQMKDNSTVHGVFSNEEDLIACLQELKELDLGISVVVSGLFDHVHACCRESGIEPHTVSTSLGVWGNTSKLPKDQNVLDMATMCGHSMVPFALIEKYAERVRKGTIAPEKAAEKISPLCTCHIFNISRATRLFEKMASEGK